MPRALCRPRGLLFCSVQPISQAGTVHVFICAACISSPAIDQRIHACSSSVPAWLVTCQAQGLPAEPSQPCCRAVVCGSTAPAWAWTTPSSPPTSSARPALCSAQTPSGAPWPTTRSCPLHACYPRCTPTLSTGPTPRPAACSPSSASSCCRRASVSPCGAPRTTSSRCPGSLAPALPH